MSGSGICLQTSPVGRSSHKLEVTNSKEVYYELLLKVKKSNLEH